MRQSVRNRIFKNFSLSVSALAFTLAASAAHSQTTTDTTPGQLPSEVAAEEEPVFTRVGSFLFQPSIEVGAIYDDNIFVEPDDEVSDLIFTFKPRIGVQTNLPRHGFNAYVEGDVGIYLEQGSTDNYYDWRTGFEGVLDVTRLWKVKGGIRYEDGHEPRGEDESVTPGAPNEIIDKERIEFYISSQARFSRVILRSKVSYRIFDYSDANTDLRDPFASGVADDSTAVDTDGDMVRDRFFFFEQDDRDRTEISAESQMVFDIAETYRPFIEVAVESIDYDKNDALLYPVADPMGGADILTQSFDGSNRDGERYTAEIGTEIDFTGVLFGEFKVGYVRRTFDDSDPFMFPGSAMPTEFDLETIDGPRLYGSLTYLPAPIASIDLIVQREVGETTLPSASGFTTTDILVAGQYEVQRDLTVGAHVGYTTRTYENIASSNREDDWWRAGLGGTWDFTRNYSLNARYEYWNRDSNVNAFDYMKNIAAVTFKAKL